MKINHSELKAVYHKHLEDEKKGLRKNCPSVEETIKLVRSQLPTPQKKHLLNHIQECAFCCKEVKAVIGIVKEEKKFIDQAKKILEKNNTRNKTEKTFLASLPFSWKFISISTLSLLLIIVLSFSLYEIFDGHHYRGNHNNIIEIIKPKKKVFIYENSINLQWSDVPGTQFYKVVLFDNSLYPIWESDKLKKNNTNLPLEILRDMKHKSNYFLLVTSYMENGEKIESQLKEFKILIK